DHLDAQCRSLKRQHSLPDESWRHPAADQPSPSQAARTAERDEQVRRALAFLSSEDQEVIRMRLFEGLTNPEAAGRLNLTDAAAAKRLARAMQRLRDALIRLRNESRAGMR
ncbi:MAG TPA: sigma-70 family RNA polymerase sigma factor, partial [Gemmataceae bacterium]|nr:sigma-70 family RNA polymerase sigma factor [Gemmataceae bacterium]